MKSRLTATALIMILLGTVSTSFASGFKIPEQGAKAMAMGDAFAAQADDPSALAYNPAGMAFLKGTQVQVGSTTILVPQTQFEGTTKLGGTAAVSEKANRDIFIAPTFYATTALESLPLSFGLGVNSFHPLAKRWDAGSDFRDSIQSLAIKPINFQPTVAYRFDDIKMAVAGGIDVTYAQVSMQKVAYYPVPAGPLAGYQELGSLGADATAVGCGYNLGLKWKPLNEISFGAAYRSRIKLELDGDANYVPTGANAAALGFGNRIRTTGSTEITLPDAFVLGIAWKPVDSLTLEFDAERTGWKSYDRLELKFGAPLSAFNGNSDAKEWENVWAYRFGVQYAVNPKIDLRAGYAYETTPVPDSTLSPELPDADRHNISFGTGLHNEFGSIDLAYMWFHWVDRTVSNVKETGTFKNDAHLLSASLTLKF